MRNWRGGVPTTYWSETVENEDKEWYGDGSSTSYVITTAEELAYLAILVNTDVDDFEGDTVLFRPSNGVLNLSTHLWTPIGSMDPVTEIFSSFNGIFDGQNNTIDQMFVIDNHYKEDAETGNWALGLFGEIGVYDDIGKAKVKDLKMTNPHVSGTYGVAAIIGAGNYGTVSNCSVVNGEISGIMMVGGVAGWNEGIISNCNNSSTITGSEYVGGIAGHTYEGGTISQCTNSGEISGVEDNDMIRFIAGITGSSKGTVTNCNNTATVFGLGYVGGIVGDGEEALVISCSNSGKISGVGYIGGVVGSVGILSNCYNTGAVFGTISIGGVAGWSLEGKITSCYNEGEVSGTEYVAGILGYGGATILNCHNVGKIIGVEGTELIRFIAGIVGYNDEATINCYNTGAVSGLGYVGGIIGDADGDVTNCYNTGMISGNAYVGGIVGSLNDDVTTFSCYNTGKITGDTSVGGIVGRNAKGTTSHCYNTGEIIGTQYVGGIVGYCNGGVVSYCYNTGEIIGESDVGAIIGINPYFASVRYVYWLNTEKFTGGLEKNQMVGIDSRTTMSSLFNAMDSGGNKVWLFMSNKTIDNVEWAYFPQLGAFANSTDGKVKADSIKSVELKLSDTIDPDSGDDLTIILIAVGIVAIVGIGVAYFVFVRKP